MKNKVNYIQAIIYFIHDETNETQKMIHNVEKLGGDSLGCILVAEFHLN